MKALKGNIVSTELGGVEFKDAVVIVKTITTISTLTKTPEQGTKKLKETTKVSNTSATLEVYASEEAFKNMGRSIQIISLSNLEGTLTNEESILKTAKATDERLIKMTEITIKL